MKIPTRAEAERLLEESRSLNPGPWVDHSRCVARAAEAIASHHPNLDAGSAYIVGTLHDIGRRFGVSGMRHILDGYTFLMDKGYDDAASICLTHSYPTHTPHAASEEWDGFESELNFVREFLAKVEFDEYDRLIQLCDAIALPDGCCLMEKRLIDVALRYGTNRYSVPRWKAYLRLKDHFDAAIGRSIYSILPGVVEATFGVKV